MLKAFDWKRSRISMLAVEPLPQSCIPQVQIGLGIVMNVIYFRCRLHVVYNLNYTPTTSGYDLRVRDQKRLNIALRG
jgi:hypothetical protein